MSVIRKPSSPGSEHLLQPGNINDLKVLLNKLSQPGQLLGSFGPEMSKMDAHQSNYIGNYINTEGQNIFRDKSGKETRVIGGASPALKTAYQALTGRANVKKLYDGLRQAGVTIKHLKTLINDFGAKKTWEHIKGLKFVKDWYKNNPYQSKTDISRIRRARGSHDVDVASDYGDNLPSVLEMIMKTRVSDFGEEGSWAWAHAKTQSKDADWMPGENVIEYNVDKLDDIETRVPAGAISSHEFTHTSQGLVEKDLLDLHRESRTPPKEETGMMTKETWESLQKLSPEKSNQLKNYISNFEEYPLNYGGAFQLQWFGRPGVPSLDVNHMYNHFGHYVGFEMNKEILLDQSLVHDYTKKGHTAKQIGWQREEWRNELYELLSPDIKKLDEHYIKKNPERWGTKVEFPQVMDEDNFKIIKEAVPGTTMNPDDSQWRHTIPTDTYDIGDMENVRTDLTKHQLYLLDSEDTFFPIELNSQFGDEIHARVMEFRKMFNIRSRDESLSTIKKKMLKVSSGRSQAERTRIRRLIDEFSGLFDKEKFKLPNWKYSDYRKMEFPIDNMNAQRTKLSMVKDFNDFVGDEDRFAKFFQTLNKILPAAAPVMMMKEDKKKEPQNTEDMLMDEFKRQGGAGRMF